MKPGSGWDKKILAPAPGTPKAFVSGAGGDCLLFTLDDGLNLNICHFAQERTDLLGKHIARGTVLGTAATLMDPLKLRRPAQAVAREAGNSRIKTVIPLSVAPHGNVDEG
jgi:hypothetical protein